MYVHPTAYQLLVTLAVTVATGDHEHVLVVCCISMFGVSQTSRLASQIWSERIVKMCVDDCVPLVDTVNDLSCRRRGTEE